jgi:hypothetical protein
MTMKLDRTNKTERLKQIKEDGLERDVHIRLTAEDHRRATAGARASYQTLTEWVISMVDMSLQP